MWGAIASAVAGAVASGAMNWASSKDTASANNAFSADMANTQYQRAVADMRKAGLNPMLAGLRASGNASPTGSQVNPMPGNSLNAGIQTAINSAISYGQLENQVNQTNSTINLNTQQSNLLKQQAVSEIAKQQQIQANTALTLQQAKQVEEATKGLVMDNYKSNVLKKPFEYGSKLLDWAEKSYNVNNSHSSKSFENSHPFKDYFFFRVKKK